MNTRRSLLVTMLLLALAVGGWWLLGPRSSIRKPVEERPSSPSPRAISRAPAVSAALPASLVSATGQTGVAGAFGGSNVTEVIRAYHRGEVDKDQVRRAIVSEQSKQPLDFYGKVVDQSGQPVVGARVTGRVGLDPGEDAYSKSEPHYVDTDSQGRFSFSGLHGLSLGIQPQKEGYLYDLKLPSRRPDNYLPDPDNPVVFTMWRLRGPEPMTHATIRSSVPCDGTAVRFDLRSGKKESAGDLVVKLVRDPVQIQRGKPFDWSVRFEIPGGGIQVATDHYQNEAPPDGYRSSVVFEFPLGMPKWVHSFAIPLYFKTANGQTYGRMQVHVVADFQPPPTAFDAEVFANPNASRNLEFDRTKQIR